MSASHITHHNRIASRPPGVPALMETDMKFVLIVSGLIIIGWFVTNAIVVIFLLWRSRTSNKGKRNDRGQSMQIDSR